MTGSGSEGSEAPGSILLSQQDWRRIAKDLHLSARELQVVQEIFDGKKLSAIAQEMHLGIGTVKTYCQRIYHKLHVHDQRELALVVLARHLKNRLR